jgi:hypothetical protein
MLHRYTQPSEDAIDACDHNSNTVDHLGVGSDMEV